MPAPVPQACIIEASAVSALGAGEELWGALWRGESAVRPVTRFDTLALPYHLAACVEDLEAPGPYPGGAVGRVQELLRRALVLLGPVPPDTRVIWAGVKGNVEHVEAVAGPGGEGLPRFPEEFRRKAQAWSGAGPLGLEVNAACASSTAALAIAAGWIASGACGSVLVCAADIVSRFTFSGFAALKALSATACRPFDARRDGLCLGDGAAALLVVSEARARALQRPVLARIAGWGVANDANHITGPARDGCGLAAAVRSALAQAGAPADAIGCFCAHGTGTVYNDAMELSALETLVGARRFPVFSIKGAVGHTLGAAGALETAACLEVFRRGTVPPTAGLEQPEDRAHGRACAEVQPFGGGLCLTTNSGFGGVNAAILLEV